jgi:hypothetical protein
VQQSRASLDGLKFIRLDKLSKADHQQLKQATLQRQYDVENAEQIETLSLCVKSLLANLHLLKVPPNPPQFRIT